MLCPVAVKRPYKIILILLTFTAVLTLLLLSTLQNGAPEHRLVGGRLQTTPPTYDKILQAEHNLPQHNLSLPYPEGGKGRYVRFSNQIKGLGWNNVLNEILLSSYLAWRANRAYVFQDYIWNPDHYPWQIAPWPWPQTPLSALISGPIAGENWAPGDNTPRSVSDRWFDTLCPPEDTDVFDTDVAKESIRDADGKYVMEHWLRLLNESPKRCVDIGRQVSQTDYFPQTFDVGLIGSGRILTIWPEFRDSPVSRLLKPSPLVKSAIERNEALLFSPEEGVRSHRYYNMMAIHIRRRDYHAACQRFSEWRNAFYGWNLLPELPDGFVPPPKSGWGYTKSKTEALYFKRCYPTEDQIVAKIMASKLDWETGGDGRSELQLLYIMTNAENGWVDALKARLRAEGWPRVVSGTDLLLDDEQIGVGMAVDMDIGRRAALFIGNGWSSLTSSVVHRRLVDGHLPSSIRFW